jgi:ribosome maturation factor RimP
MALVDTVTEVVAPVIGELGAVLVDVEHRGALLRVVVDDEGGIGLSRLADVTRAVSDALDEADPLPGHYTLEVSSPGLERPLRRPEQFERAVGEKVAVKTRPSYEGGRRITGVLASATPQEVEIVVEGAGPVTVPLAEIDRARTVFDWGPAPKPGKGSRPGAAKSNVGKAAAAKPDGATPDGAKPDGAKPEAAERNAVGRGVAAAESRSVGELSGTEQSNAREG